MVEIVIFTMPESKGLENENTKTPDSMTCAKVKICLMKPDNAVEKMKISRKDNSSQT